MCEFAAFDDRHFGEAGLSSSQSKALMHGHWRLLSPRTAGLGCCNYVHSTSVPSEVVIQSECAPVFAVYGASARHLFIRSY